LIGAKYQDFSANHMPDIDKTKHDCNYNLHNKC